MGGSLISVVEAVMDDGGDDGDDGDGGGLGKFSKCDDGCSGVWEGVWEGGGLPITGMEVVFACDGMMVVMVMDLVAMKGLMKWG